MIFHLIVKRVANVLDDDDVTNKYNKFSGKKVCVAIEIDRESVI